MRFIFLLAASLALADAEEANLVLSEARLSTIWVGVGKTGMPFYRLELSFGGTGTLAETDMRWPVSVWKIQRWNLKGTNLVFSGVAPATKQTDTVSISGSWRSYWVAEVIALEIKAPGRADSEKVLLRKEKDLSWFALDTKRATQEARTNSVSKP